MLKVKIIKGDKEWYKSPIKQFGINIKYENKKYIKFDYANLYNANLENANLYNANLENANLYNANLYNANLENANLENANLYNAKLDKEEMIRKGKINDKKVIVYKKCHEKIVELELQIGSIVFSINNYKCRTNKVKVISIDGDKTKGNIVKSDYDSSFIYEVGKIIEVKDFNLMYNVECSTGIHFFYKKEDAENYSN